MAAETVLVNPRHRELEEILRGLAYRANVRCRERRVDYRDFNIDLVLRKRKGVLSIDGGGSRKHSAKSSRLGVIWYTDAYGNKHVRARSDRVRVRRGLADSMFACEFPGPATVYPHLIGDVRIWADCNDTKAKMLLEEIWRMSNPTYSFRNGVLQYEGRDDEAETVIERESSNGMTIYTAIRWKRSRFLSCNCPGWANRRGCKHVKELRNIHQDEFVTHNQRARRAPTAALVTERRGRGLTFDN